MVHQWALSMLLEVVESGLGVWFSIQLHACFVSFADYCVSLVG